MQKTFFIFLTICTVQLSTSAQNVSFVDVETKQPVPGVVVKLQSIAQQTSEALVTDSEGKVSTSLVYPVIVVTSHLGYESISDTLFSSSENTLFLVPKINVLNEVVVTGQFSPRSASHSVFKIQIIDLDEIQKRGALTLEEALNNQLNIRINQDLAIGSSTINLQGISSQNVKILVDGVPLVNRSGNGNGADLSQINLQNIERIEIVEGPMAVNFGANALAGVINLITKKDFQERTELNASVQTESVGSEYGLDRGRHIQSLGLNHRLNDNWSILLSGQHNDFLGFTGDANERQHEWNPKEQWTGNGLLKYKGAKSSIHYRFDLLNQLIQDFGSTQNNFLSSGENQPFAIDETYDSRRFTHQLQAEGQISFLNRFTTFASYSDFERQKKRFAKNIVTSEENLTTGEGDQDLSTYKVWEFGGTGYLSIGDQTDLQIGYHISLEEVGGGRILSQEQSIQEYALYSSAEWRPLPKTTFRPGLRYTQNSAFGSQLIPSLQIKYELSQQTQFRLSYGRGFRSPSVRELYFEFVDSNHRIFGNPDLTPEKSDHISINSLSHYKLAATKVKVDFNLFYNNIEDQISLGQNISDVTSTTYLNIARFKTLGATLNQRATWGAFSGSLGVSYIGRFNQISDNEDNLAEFFYSQELNTNISYTLPKGNTSFNAFYKYTDRVQSYFTEINDQNEQIISIGEISDYHWLDATIVHPFKKAFELTFGIRNILNVTRINNSGLSGGAHSGGTTRPISYGRSYFLKLNYNLNLK